MEASQPENVEVAQAPAEAAEEAPVHDRDQAAHAAAAAAKAAEENAQAAAAASAEAAP